MASAKSLTVVVETWALIRRPTNVGGTE